MATVTELKAVLKDTLEKRGVLGHLKARIRAEVFNALDDDREPRPSLSHENLLINELIREYLEFNKYKYTASVLIAAHFLRGPPDEVQNVFLSESTLHPANKHLSWKPSRRSDDDHPEEGHGAKNHD
ncbi:lisH domain-containing protein FOPNL isoform X2 [Grammomys surdaster]|uniref:lisH domain-containing protein FOPNL isoform X2 n=1 Tax=Grammomys surdaster TaxID=491861 RepID=UPI00109EE480|nr:lisH domain-containing protein FOPNL isoform X2 [Grammomys surdaster]